MAWYTDKTVVRPVTACSHSTVALRQGQRRTSTSALGCPSAPTSACRRGRTSRSSLLEQEILSKGESAYTYDPAKMMQVNYNNEWNAAHTIKSAAEFDSGVREASYSFPCS